MGDTSFLIGESCAVERLRRESRQLCSSKFGSVRRFSNYTRRQNSFLKSDLERSVLRYQEAKKITCAEVDRASAELLRRQSARNERSFSGTSDPNAAIRSRTSHTVKSGTAFLGSRGTLVDSRGALVERRGTVVDSKGAFLESRGTLVDSRGTFLESRGTVFKRRTLAQSGGPLVDSRSRTVVVADGRGALNNRCTSVNSRGILKVWKDLPSKPQTAETRYVCGKATGRTRAAFLCQNGPERGVSSNVRNRKWAPLDRRSVDGSRTAPPAVDFVNGRTAVGRRADNRQAGKRVQDEATARRQWAGGRAEDEATARRQWAEGRAEGSDDTTALHQWRELRCKPSRDKPKSASKRKSTGSEMKKKQRHVRGEAEMSTNSGKKRDSEGVRLSRQRDTLGRSDGVETSGGDCRRGRGELAHRLSWVGVSAGRDNGGSEGDREDLRSPDRRGTRLEGCGQGKSAAGLKRGSAAPRVGYTGTSGRGGRFSGARSGGKSGLLAAGQRSRQTTSGGTKTPGLELMEGGSAARFSKLHERLVGAAETSTASNKKLVRGVADDADQWMWDRFDSIMMALKDFSKDGGTYRRTNRARSTRLGAPLARILLAAGVVGAVATPSQLQGALKNFSSLYFKHGTPDVITLRC